MVALLVVRCKSTPANRPPPEVAVGGSRNSVHAQAASKLSGRDLRRSNLNTELLRHEISCSLGSHFLSASAISSIPRYHSSKSPSIVVAFFHLSSIVAGLDVWQKQRSISRAPCRTSRSSSSTAKVSPSFPDWIESS